MGLFRKYVNQTRKPEGFLGKLMVLGMNGGHAALADWGMSFLDGNEPETIAELGCGGGRNAAELLKRFPNAKVTAVDYSEVSVEKTKKTNQVAIDSGRCKVLQGDVSSLSFSDGNIDLATAFETIYFWSGLERCFAEVARVLKPGGRFLIVNESNGEDDTGRQFEKVIDGMKCYTAEEIKVALEAAGFSHITIHHHPKKPWIAVKADKGAKRYV